MKVSALLFTSLPFLASVGLLAASAPGASAEVSLPHLLSDHMVVQRDRPVRIWGRAAAAEKVTVSFRGAHNSTVADELGNWSVTLPPGNAGGPFAMEIAGSNTITLQDVMAGEVWVASGQSNMEFEMAQLVDPEKAEAAVDDPGLRLVKLDKEASAYPRSDAGMTAWAAATPASVKDFSAVAYYFAREIRSHEHVPVGVIETNIGGTPAESWTSLDALSSDPGLMPIFAARARMADSEERNRQLEQLEQKNIADAKAAGNPLPVYPWHPPLNTWAPGELYNAMIAPLTPFAIRGVIWYQGESNSVLDRAPDYARLFPAMITDWRDHWREGDFPFLFVQIANFTSTPAEDWAAIRDAQRRTLSLRNTAMAVTIDIGNPDNIHPKDKLDVGLRLSLAARAMAYGEKLEYSGPLFREADNEGSGLRVWFTHADGLTAKGGDLEGFEVAGESGAFEKATARVDASAGGSGNGGAVNSGSVNSGSVNSGAVTLTSPGIAHPVRVRYGWANNPACNLYNAAGLPASPFEGTAR